MQPNDDEVERLVTLVEKGQEGAIDFAFGLLRSLLPGGALEDVERGLATVADKNPRYFLQQVKAHRYSVMEITGIVEKTSESLTDDTPGQLAALRHRLQSISDVRDRDLERSRDAVVRALRGVIEQSQETITQ